MAAKLEVNGILETVLYASDLVAIDVFYADVLGMTVADRADGKYLFYRCGNQMLLYFNPEISKQNVLNESLPIPPHGCMGSGHVCFRASADELDEWKKRLEAADVAIESDLIWPGGRGRSLYFRDPAGNCLEFAEPKIWGLS